MMPQRQPRMIITLAAFAAILASTPIVAAPPDNDTCERATVIHGPGGACGFFAEGTR